MLLREQEVLVCSRLSSKMKMALYYVDREFTLPCWVLNEEFNEGKRLSPSISSSA